MGIMQHLSLGRSPLLQSCLDTPTKRRNTTMPNISHRSGLATTFLLSQRNGSITNAILHSIRQLLPYDLGVETHTMQLDMQISGIKVIWHPARETFRQVSFSTMCRWLRRDNVLCKTRTPSSSRADVGCMMPSLVQRMAKLRSTGT